MSKKPQELFKRKSHHRASLTRKSESLAFTRSQGEDDVPGAEPSSLEAWSEKVDKLFTVTPQRMRKIVDSFVDVLDAGLSKEDQAVPMLPTFVFGWPTGDETGSYLAIDLGGTNMRVVHVELEGEGKFEVTQSKYRLTEELKQGEGEDLFDWCAASLHKFIEDNYEPDIMGIDPEDYIPLGFTFSYPCVQARIDHGELLRWTKGFGVKNVEGHDCAAMFSKAIEKRKLPVKLVALINDTTGTLIASSYVDTRTKIGVIFGTGCNAAYTEEVENIPKIANYNLPPKQLMAINCEWGAFDSDTHSRLPRTKWDEIIDHTSNKPGQQAFEKMIAGLYLGEVFRLIISDMIDEGVLFKGQETYKIEKPFVFDTAFLSLIESDVTDELLTVTGLFSHFFALETTEEERQFFRHLAKLIGTRSARLSACGIAAIVTKKNYLDLPDGCGVATDGSLYNKYPNFPERLESALVDIFGDKGRNIVTYNAEDGSGVGSAIIAAMTKARRENHIFDNV